MKGHRANSSVFFYLPSRGAAVSVFLFFLLGFSQLIQRSTAFPDLVTFILEQDGVVETPYGTGSGDNYSHEVGRPDMTSWTVGLQDPVAPLVGFSNNFTASFHPATLAVRVGGGDRINSDGMIGFWQRTGDVFLNLQPKFNYLGFFIKLHPRAQSTIDVFCSEDGAKPATVCRTILLEDLYETLASENRIERSTELEVAIGFVSLHCVNGCVFDHLHHANPNTMIDHFIGNIAVGQLSGEWVRTTTTTTVKQEIPTTTVKQEIPTTIAPTQEEEKPIEEEEKTIEEGDDFPVGVVIGSALGGVTALGLLGSGAYYFLQKQNANSEQPRSLSLSSADDFETVVRVDV